MSETRIILNKAKCTLCNTELVSRHTHDYKTCKCGNLSVDGGLSYARRNYTTVFEELSVFDDSPFEEIRKVFERGSFGKKGDEALHWIKLMDMSDDHLLSTIKYCKDNLSYGSDRYLDLYIKEKEYRGIQ